MFLLNKTEVKANPQEPASASSHSWSPAPLTATEPVLRVLRQTMSPHRCCCGQGWLCSACAHVPGHSWQHPPSSAPAHRPLPGACDCHKVPTSPGVWRAHSRCPDVSAQRFLLSLTPRAPTPLAFSTTSALPPSQSPSGSAPTSSPRTHDRRSPISPVPGTAPCLTRGKEGPSCVPRILCTPSCYISGLSPQLSPLCINTSGQLTVY